MPTILAAEAPWRELNGLLQRGVWCRASTPVPLGQFLIEQLGLGEAYVRDRIETIFLDGLVVDDLERSIVHDGSTVTLSAAMPGLVGATLRRGGFYKAMRSEISWSAQSSADEPVVATPGLVRVKLFNLILREAGPDLLRRGVLVDPAAAVEALGPGTAEAVEAGGRILVTVIEGDPSENRSCT
jgi:hypothetical protein